jgi:hypothetical protein
MKKGQGRRRVGALERLKVQLESEKKTDKKTGKLVLLTEKDKKRINKEIETLTNKTKAE